MKRIRKKGKGAGEEPVGEAMGMRVG